MFRRFRLDRSAIILPPRAREVIWAWKVNRAQSPHFVASSLRGFVAPHQSLDCRVAQGGFPPRAPTDPDVRN